MVEMTASVHNAGQNVSLLSPIKFIMTRRRCCVFLYFVRYALYRVIFQMKVVNDIYIYVYICMYI